MARQTMRQRSLTTWRTFWMALTPLLVQIDTPLAAQGPAGAWQQYARVEDAGFSASMIARAREFADSIQSGGVMAVVHGRVLLAWGEVDRKLELHSVRKSLVSALFGTAVDRGAINLDRTLGDIGFEDSTPLTLLERGARIRDLLAARSGIYLPSAYASQDQDDERPARDSHAPGTFFFYNNWDFNAAGALYERLVEPNLYTAFRDRLAVPLGMQDYTPSDGFLVYEPSGSHIPAQTFRMSTRDLARFGQLFLQHGRWGGRQVLSTKWITESTATTSDLGNGRGYGYLWWTYSKGSLGARYPALDQHAMYAGIGTGGQLVLVIPDAGLVLVHRGDTDNDRRINGASVWQLAELILAARTGSPVTAPATVLMRSVPLLSQLPAHPRPPYVQLDSTRAAEFLGDYAVAERKVAQVFTFKNRLFANFPGLGEAELLTVGHDEFTVMPIAAASIRFKRDSSGKVIGLAAKIGKREMAATKQ